MHRTKRTKIVRATRYPSYAWVPRYAKLSSVDAKGLGVDSWLWTRGGRDVDDKVDVCVD